MVFTQLRQPISFPFGNVSCRLEKRRVHRYENSALSDYCLEAIENQTGFYMTSCKAGVKKGDRIFISNADGSSEYQVNEIDFYCDPADMWVAKLSVV